jgi:predicted dehydrogenase
MSLGVGVVGLGEIGQYHLPGVRESEVAELVAVCDLDRELAERSAGGKAEVFDSFEELLAVDGLQVVDLCLPHHLHLPCAIKALESGKHVILEKPMVIGVDACREISAAAESAQRLVGVSHNQIFFEPHRKLAAMIESGELGDLIALRCQLTIGGKYGGWREDPASAGGGLLYDAGVHRVYVAQMLGGSVRSVSATMDSPGAENRFAVIFQFDGGAIGTLDGSYHAPDGVFDDRVEVVGTRGMARVRGCEAFFEGYLDGGPMLEVFTDGEWRASDVKDSWDASVARSVGSILEAFAAGDRPLVDDKAATSTVELIEAAYRSAREGGEQVFVGAAG